jgi:hypothetical protein
VMMRICIVGLVRHVFRALDSRLRGNDGARGGWRAIGSNSLSVGKNERPAAADEGELRAGAECGGPRPFAT